MSTPDAAERCKTWLVVAMSAWLCVVILADAFVPAVSYSDETIVELFLLMLLLWAFHEVIH